MIHESFLCEFLEVCSSWTPEIMTSSGSGSHTEWYQLVFNVCELFDWLGRFLFQFTCCSIFASPSTLHRPHLTPKEVFLFVSALLNVHACYRTLTVPSPGLQCEWCVKLWRSSGKVSSPPPPVTLILSECGESQTLKKDNWPDYECVLLWQELSNQFLCLVSLYFQFICSLSD